MSAEALPKHKELPFGARELLSRGMGDGTKIDPVFLALQRFNRRQYDECITLCSELLANNPYDQVCRA